MPGYLNYWVIKYEMSDDKPKFQLEIGHFVPDDLIFKYSVLNVSRILLGISWILFPRALREVHSVESAESLSGQADFPPDRTDC